MNASSDINVWLQASAPIRMRPSPVAGVIRVCQVCGGELTPRNMQRYRRLLLCSEPCWDAAADAAYTQRETSR